MRLCLVSREVSPFFGAGIGTYITEMARAWAAAGHEVHILTAPHDSVKQFLSNSPGNPELAARFSGIEIHIAAAPAGPVPPPGFEHYGWTVYRSLLKLHASLRFDYIEFPDYGAEGYFALRAHRSTGAFDPALLAVRLHTSTRICRSLNGEFWLSPQLAKLQCAEECSIALADAVVSPTTALLERTFPPRSRTANAATPPQQRAVVPYPFDRLALLQNAAPAEPPAGEPRVPILYFGRLEHRKGVDLLIRAGLDLLERRSDLVIRCIGGDTRTGPRSASMLEHLKSLIPPAQGSSFEFLPPLSRPELAAHIQATIACGGLCCFPSRWENFPNACIEAMALGAPVVGSSSGGMAEIVQDGISGLLSAPAAAELAEAMERLLSDRSLRERLGESARKRIATLCAPAIIVQQMEQLISRHHAQSAGPTPAAISPREVHSPTFAEIIDDPALTPNLRAAIEQSEAEWVTILSPSTSPSLFTRSDSLETALAQVLALDPNLDLILIPGSTGNLLHIPLPFSPELLAIFPPGAAAVTFRRERVLRLPPLPQTARPVQCWALCAALAAADARAFTLAEPISERSPAEVPESAHAAAVAQLAHAYPELAASPVSLQLAAWIAAQQEQKHSKAEAALREQLQRRQEHINHLESQLCNLRYTLADRVNQAMKSVGIQGALKSALSRLGGKERTR